MSKDRLLSIETEMRMQFINRDVEIRGMLLGALTKENVMLLGPPGTAKSVMASRFASYLNSNHFEWLLTQFTTPEELFGPIDMAMLEQSVYRRLTISKLPEADTAFLDETFKGGSAILNTNLKILGPERTFHNNGVPVKVPLIFAIGASNELPEDDEGLAALYDRFMLRYHVTYIDQVERFEDLLRMPDEPVRYVEPMDVAELRTDIEAVKLLTMSEDAIDSYKMLWETLIKEGFHFSDRRYRQAMKIMAATSWLNGEVEIVSDSLLSLENVFWDEPNQIRDIKQIVRSCVNPYEARAQEILEAARERIAEINTGNIIIKEELLSVAQQLKHLSTELGTMPERPAVTEAKRWIDENCQDMMMRLIQGEGLDDGKDEAIPTTYEDRTDRPTSLQPLAPWQKS
jgi:MoxR-like ATPase